MESKELRALIGLLTGDPASPILWNLFLADLKMMPDMDDVFLAAVRISLLAQADDMLLVSLSARGLRTKLLTLEKWCACNFILINLIKTIVLIFEFGRTQLLRSHLVFMLGNTQLRIEIQENMLE